MIMLSFQVNAALVELHSTTLYTGGGGPGTGRAVGLEAVSNFNISSIGIYGSLVSQSFDVQIYSSTNGNQANSLLASSTATVGGTGVGWHDIGINFSFNVGDFYVLNWQPTTSNSSWGTPQYYHDSDLPITLAGLVTLINGVEGFNAASFGNFLHPSLRINTGGTGEVPIPAAVFMFAPALLGFLGLRRRIRNTVA